MTKPLLLHARVCRISPVALLDAAGKNPDFSDNGMRVSIRSRGGAPMMGEPAASPFGDMRWLSAFQSDRARLAAFVLVCVTLIAIFCLPRLARVWAEDRADQRAHERRKAALIAAVDEAVARRKAGRLKLDD